MTENLSSIQYTFFYGGPFSQWYQADFTVDGQVYCCVEQYMMAEKARLFGDDATLAKILATRDPKKQKALGRKVQNFDEKVWNSHAKDIVYKGNYAKYSQNPGLLNILSKTHPTLLVEASPTDRIWGIGLSADDPRSNDPAKWRGTNWLGEVLTKIRENLEK